MKKVFRLTVLCLIMLSLMQAALAAPLGAMITHPEVGENMTVEIENGIPSFQIYGINYYRFIDKAEPYRGMDLTAGGISVDAALGSMFATVDNEVEGVNEVVSFAYTGMMEQYQEQLDSLERGERILAVKRLNGMEGDAGFEALKQMPGFEAADVEALKAANAPAYVTVDGKVMQTKVLMFYFEEEKWEEAYMERYHFLQTEGGWQLYRIVKEYGNEYPERPQYLHGALMQDKANLEPVMAEMLQDAAFGQSKAEVQALGAWQDKGGSLSGDAVLFRMPVQVAFQFEQDRLTQAAYTFQNSQSYYSAFISVYMRLHDPISVDENGTMVWSIGGLTVTLTNAGEAPTLTLQMK